VRKYLRTGITQDREEVSENWNQHRVVKK